ncbi:Unknown protein [Striga hermonthica]|uniref:Glutathione S-transferase T3-like n=1 Tax=Striga hermonthica TaxID=68872 RepID=A0A9N7RHF7_STRHE|nr:Unknown protein [Striga hermonthica]
MLNVPISNPQCSKPVKALKKAAKDSQNSNTSQLSIAKKDWTTKEEEALTEAWLYISVDADVGNNQKNSAMWARVLHIWKQKMGPDHYTMRNNNSLQCHWFQIRSAVSKFVAKYEQLERHPQSGTNSQDLPLQVSSLLENIGQEIARPEGRKNCKDKKRKLNEEKGVVDALNRLQSTLEKQVGVNQASLDMKEQAMKKEMELKEQVMRREIELKEAAQKQRKEDHAMKMKEQRKQHIMNQDLSVLSPSLRASYEAMQAQIMKDWENEILY